MAKPPSPTVLLAMPVRKLIPVFFSALLCACAVPSSNVPATSTTATLANSQWKVVMLNNGQQAVASVLNGSNLTLAFDDAGRASGSSGCNRFSASYAGIGNNLRFGQAAGTRMMCAQPQGLMEQETQMLSALGSVTRWSMEDGRLVLRTETETVALVLERFVAPGAATNLKPTAP